MGTNGSESDAHIIASLRTELSECTVRSLELELRIVELEWVTNAFLQAPDTSEWDGNALPAQANDELERRARRASDLE